MANNRYNNNMTENDFNFIKENYEKMSVEEIAKKLNKCKTTIYKAISKMNLKYVNRDGKIWTKEEIDYLKENYLIKTYKEIGLDLNRSKKSVEGKAHFLNLKKSNNSRNWTEEEIEILKNSINSETYEEIAKKINRSLPALYNKVWELQLIPDEFKGSRKLKKEQILFIKENCYRMTDNELSKKFNVSVETIEEIRGQYGLKKTGNEIKGPTYIESFVKDLLDELNIEYKYNQKLGDYKPDFYIESLKIVIEVHGDYYHCNPYLYQNGPKDEIQIKHVIHDYYKKCFYLSNGYNLLEIWENDINKTPDNVKEKIKSAVYGQDLQKSIDN